MCRPTSSRPPSIPSILIGLPGSVRNHSIRIFVSGTSRQVFAWALVHFAFGSSAGTENDTWVSARIKIFMMMIRILITKSRTRRITLRMMTKTQNFAANCCATFPLKSGRGFDWHKIIFPLPPSFGNWSERSERFFVKGKKSSQQGEDGHCVDVWRTERLCYHFHNEVNWSPKLCSTTKTRLSVIYKIIFGMGAEKCENFPNHIQRLGRKLVSMRLISSSGQVNDQRDFSLVNTDLNSLTSFDKRIINSRSNTSTLSAHNT